MQIRVGDFVKKGSPLAVIYANAADKLAKVKELFLSAIVFSEKPVPRNNLVLGVVDKQGLSQLLNENIIGYAYK